VFGGSALDREPSETCNMERGVSERELPLNGVPGESQDNHLDRRPLLGQVIKLAYVVPLVP
jgi:hypothetical protein